VNPFEAYVARVADPLSAHARSLRKSLLLASAAGIAVASTGLVPTKISALGIEFSQADRVSMLWLLGATVAFLLASFAVVSLADFIAWRSSIAAKEWNEETAGYESLKKQILEARALSDEDRAELEEHERRMGAMWRNAGHLNRYQAYERAVGPVSWARIGVEFIAPLAAGGAALVLLVRVSL